MQESWNKKAGRIRKGQKREPLYSDFFDFFEIENNLVNDPVFSREAMNEMMAPERNRSKTRITSYRTEVLAEVTCLFCKGEHDLEECCDFLKRIVAERNNWIFEKRLCFCCFKPDHVARMCNERRTCKKCKGSHPTILHRDTINSDDSNVLNRSIKDDFHFFFNRIVPLRKAERVDKRTKIREQKSAKIK